jgi:hypothetical protein
MAQIVAFPRTLAFTRAFPKRMFVCANLSALIRAREVKNDKASLWNATQLLCSLWDHTFGEAGTFRASEAQGARAHAQH